MAFYDDLEFIVSHIRNSYITSDDTGMCELVILNETFPFKQQPQQQRYRTVPMTETDITSGQNHSSEQQAQSLEIVSDMDLVAHRRRSNTAQRLDRLKKERQNQAMIKNVQWRENPDPPQNEELEHIFAKKEVSITTDKKSTSLLSELLEKLPAMPTNPFTEYAQFGGNSYVGATTKKISIFLTMLPSAQRAYPMPVTVVNTAKVQELVGLICWKYTYERREPKLRNNVDCYSLHIAEDDGEVDLDFPCLDPREIIAKFGFQVLALVEKGSPNQRNENIVTIHVAGEGSCSFVVESLCLTLGNVLERFVKQKCGNGGQSSKAIYDYKLTKRREPEVKLNMNSTLASVETLDFCLIKEGRRKSAEKDDWPPNGMSVMEAPLYQSYVVSALNRVRSKTSIHLGISGEKIEIVPMQQQKGSKIWSRSQKAVSYDTDAIAGCEIIEIKSTGKTVFRLTCLVQGNNDYKQHDFEAESRKATEIVQKVNHILQLRLSQVRRDYLALKERKLAQRRSFR